MMLGRLDKRHKIKPRELLGVLVVYNYKTKIFRIARSCDIVDGVVQAWKTGRFYTIVSVPKEPINF